MVQKLFGFAFGGTGIVGVLIAAGIILHLINASFSKAFLTIGLVIGGVLGLLGIVSIFRKTFI